MSSFLSDSEELDLHPPDSKVLNDSVHGHVEFHPLCMAIIDTPQFQRLRHLKQLGMAYYVYPGASHNRFEHCLGVGHLAGVLASTLKERQPELGITTRDILCIQIAGLCHDLGHGPFSHAFEKVIKPLIADWKHEQSSVRMFNDLVDKNNLMEKFEKYGLSEDHKEFIRELILGDKNKLQRTSECGKGKPFLYEIVANGRNGVDVDKWDYFKRDGQHLGIPVTFDHSRFIRFARVVEVDGEKQICLRDKECFNLYEMFLTRHSLHRKAYKHRVVQAIEVMMVEALRAANDYILIPGDNGKECKMSECIEEGNIDAFANLTDHVASDILTCQMEGGELDKAKEILRNIERRKLYKCLKESVPISDHDLIDRKNNRKAIRTEILEKLPQDKVTAHNLGARLVVQIVNLDIGKEHSNPNDKMMFYTKDDPDKAKPLDSKHVSTLLPRKQFKEMMVRVFFCPTGDEKKDGACKELLEEGFTKWCEANGLGIPENIVDIRRSLEDSQRLREDFSTPSRPTHSQMKEESARKAKTRLEFSN